MGYHLQQLIGKHPMLNVVIHVRMQTCDLQKKFIFTIYLARKLYRRIDSVFGKLPNDNGCLGLCKLEAETIVHSLLT